MTRIAIHAVAAAVALSTAVTAAGPRFTSTWKAPDGAGVSFAGKKVAALIMSYVYDPGQTRKATK